MHGRGKTDMAPSFEEATEKHDGKFDDSRLLLILSVLQRSTIICPNSMVDFARRTRTSAVGLPRLRRFPQANERGISSRKARRCPRDSFTITAARGILRANDNVEIHARTTDFFIFFFFRFHQEPPSISEEVDPILPPDLAGGSAVEQVLKRLGVGSGATEAIPRLPER